APRRLGQVCVEKAAPSTTPVLWRRARVTRRSLRRVGPNERTPNGRRSSVPISIGGLRAVCAVHNEACAAPPRRRGHRPVATGHSRRLWPTPDSEGGRHVPSPDHLFFAAQPRARSYKVRCPWAL